MKRKMSWLLGAAGIAAVSWLYPKRRKKPMRNVMRFTNNALSWARFGKMKSGMRKIRGLVR